MTNHNEPPRVKDEQDPLSQALNVEIPEALRERLTAQFTAFEAHLEAESAAPRSAPLRRWRGSYLWGSALGAAALFAVIFMLFSATPNPTWAEVQQQFAKAPFFSATIYRRTTPLSTPEMVEVWRGEDGALRLHQSGVIVFIPSSGPSAWFSLNSRERIEPIHLGTDSHYSLLTRTVEMLPSIIVREGFSFDTLLRGMNGSGAPSSMQLDPDSLLATDVAVFNLSKPSIDEWCQVSVARSNRLPIRLVVLNPSIAERIEINFEYQQPQHVDFFDAEKFGQELKRTDLTQASLVYALLEQGNNPTSTPQQSFTGYHVPTLERIVRHADGVVVVDSSHSVNKGPNGEYSTGFGHMTDDLGTQYLCKLESAFPDGKATELFIPLTYGNVTTPTQLKLTAIGAEEHYKRPRHAIGSLALTVWETTPMQADRNIIFLVASEAIYREDWPLFQRLIDSIPGDPSTDDRAYRRELLRIEVLRKFERGDEVNMLIERLGEDLVKGRAGDAGASLLYLHLCRLANTGRTEAAAEAVRRAQARLEAGFPSHQRREMTDEWRHDLARSLYTTGQLDRVTIGQVMGESMLADKRFAEFMREKTTAERRAANLLQPFHNYMDQLAQLYEQRPLPTQWELIEPVGEKWLAAGEYRPAILAGYRVIQLRGMTISELIASLTEQENLEVLHLEYSDDLANVRLQKDLIIHEGLDTHSILPDILAAAGFAIERTTQTLPVLVAQYDGRKLANWRDVEPTDFGDESPGSESHGSMTAPRLLEMYRQAAQGVDRIQGRDGEVLLIDETGLPHTPGEGQTAGSIALTDSAAISATTHGLAIYRAWMTERFGITMTEENRPVATYRIMRRE